MEPREGHIAETIEDRGANRLIASLPESERQALLREVRPSNLDAGVVLAEAGEKLRHGYFPESGVISLVTVLEDGGMIEAATVGNEGMVGLPIVLGAGASPNVRSVAQITGKSLQIPAGTLLRLSEELPAFRARLLRYTQALMVQAAQSAVCNRRHTAEQRGAKWLLLSHDRVEEDQFHLTQEFLSQMLGVRRASVTEVANRLRDAGLIEYRRGRITIRDRSGLERAACSCYRQIREEYDTYLASGDGAAG